MTTLYRTPNLIIDVHEWHAVVRLNGTRVSLCYKWRPLSTRAYAWSNLSSWQGPRPKHFCNRFWMFKNHIRAAMRSEAERRAAIAGLRGPISGAACRNRGTRAETLLTVAV